MSELNYYNRIKSSLWYLSNLAQRGALDSDKNIRLMPELALEMRLLRYELEDVPANSNRPKLEELRSLLCDLSREFSNEKHICTYLHRLAA